MTKKLETRVEALEKREGINEGGRIVFVVDDPQNDYVTVDGERMDRVEFQTWAEQEKPNTTVFHIVRGDTT